ncbi:MAG: hypothetical protein QXR62_05945, partial [Candidatus Bathyarchaeia archaeon]
GLLDLGREEACGKLAVAPVISQALAADALPATRLPSAGAVLEVFLETANSLGHDALASGFMAG